ncbi:MAG: MFS transporter [Anaerolineae bacterium]|nr:MFS transporter [Anaerolineae bacterium]
MAFVHSLRRAPLFESLRDRDFRWFWMGRLASSATMQMGGVAQGWLAYELTGSALALGSVAASRSLARLLLSLYAGALADRIEKRTLLIITRAGMLCLALVLALLIFTGALRLWHLVAYSFLGGVVSSFMMPAQKAFLAQLVDRDTLLNAVSLTSVGMGLMGIFGAALAGYLIAWLGAQSVYFLIAALYAWALYTLTQLPEAGEGNGSSRSVWSDLREGVSYLKLEPVILPLLGIAVVRAVLGWSYRTLMPVYADEVLHFDARGLGILSAAPNVGSLIASLVLASLGGFHGKGRILLLSGITMGLALIGFSNTPHVALVMLLLGVVGAARNATMITNQTLIQINAADVYRGRVMSMYMMAMGLMPLGTVSAGALADAFSVPLAISAQGALMAGVFIWFWFSRSRLRNLA